MTGIILALLSAFCIALTPNTAKIAYQEGANPVAVITLRSLIGLAGVGIYMLCSGRNFRTTASNFWFCAITGTTQALVTIGIVGAVAYIDVSLAVLIFFLHPFLIAIVDHFRGENRLTVYTVAFIVIAFFGLVLALSVDFGTLDLFGMGLAFGAMFSVTAMIYGVIRSSRTTGVLRANFYMLLWASVYLIIGAFAGTSLHILEPLQLPESRIGWLALAATGVTFSLGYVMFFIAITIIGSVRTATLTFIEPVVAILIAVTLVGEWLSPLQWVGVALVMSGLFCSEIFGKKQLRKQ